MMRFMLLFSRQGKLRLQKWYLATSDKERKKMVRELMQVVLARKPKMCSFLEWRDLKVVYKRYASLYFCCAIEGQDNELITLELIHRYVELLPPPLPPPAASQGSFSTWEGGICVVTRSSFPLICTLPSFLAAVGPLSSAVGGTA
uniref:Adaptor related protein complex 1 subunit sigma 1 n=1 Tax=Myotis myotis TaxID=51298 RepID=A0A7J7XX58_MYOMY|nr:adaptor related protein complex 1 subunit sigma 1 [Myotis myotis]